MVSSKQSVTLTVSMVQWIVLHRKVTFWGVNTSSIHWDVKPRRDIGIFRAQAGFSSVSWVLLLFYYNCKTTNHTIGLLLSLSLILTCLQTVDIFDKTLNCSGRTLANRGVSIGTRLPHLILTLFFGSKWSPEFSLLSLFSRHSFVVVLVMCLFRLD